jgi:methionyl-tRNA formyltransferase
MLMTETAVKKFANSKNIQVLQPKNLKDPHFINELKLLKADLQVVVAFRMLPEIVWNMPPMGTINLHGSLLPQYRGAAPINWAIINGEKETGVTTFKLQHAIDTGNILLYERIPLTDQMTAGELHDIMKEVGAAVLVKTVKGLIQGNLEEKPQAAFEDASLKLAPKIHTEDCRINFHQSVEAVHNRIRGLSPFPGAFTEINGKSLKIFRTETEVCTHNTPTGTPITDGKKFLKFSCADGYILCKEVQLEGKKRMDAETFLRGYHLS